MLAYVLINIRDSGVAPPPYQRVFLKTCIPIVKNNIEKKKTLYHRLLVLVCN